MNRPLPVPEPTPTEFEVPYWDAASQGRLVTIRCLDCAALVWYPRPFCTECGSRSVEWHELTGLGEVYSFTIVRKAAPPFSEAVPYVVAYVQLAEGLRVLTNIVDCEVELVNIGMPVEVTFQTGDHGHALHRFRPAPPS